MTSVLTYSDDNKRNIEITGRLPTQPDSSGASRRVILNYNTTTLKVRDNFLIGTPPARFMRVKVTAAP